jgi:hypothetical protein
LAGYDDPQVYYTRYSITLRAYSQNFACRHMVGGLYNHPGKWSSADWRTIVGTRLPHCCEFLMRSFPPIKAALPLQVIACASCNHRVTAVLCCASQEDVLASLYVLHQDACCTPVLPGHRTWQHRGSLACGHALPHAQLQVHCTYAVSAAALSAGFSRLGALYVQMKARG